MLSVTAASDRGRSLHPLVLLLAMCAPCTARQTPASRAAARVRVGDHRAEILRPRSLFGRGDALSHAWTQALAEFNVAAQAFFESNFMLSCVYACECHACRIVSPLRMCMYVCLQLVATRYSSLSMSAVCCVVSHICVLSMPDMYESVFIVFDCGCSDCGRRFAGHSSLRAHQQGCAGSKCQVTRHHCDD